METILSEQILPKKFELKNPSKFILKIDGIDSFLFKEVRKELWTSNFWRKKRKLYVKMYDAVSPSAENQIREWMVGKMKKRTVEIFLLDSFNTIISKTKYEDVKLSKVKFETLSYTTKKTSIEIELELTYKKEIFEY